MLVTLLFKWKGNVNFTGTGASLFSFFSLLFSKLTWQQNHRAIIVQTEQQRVRGQTLVIHPALRIPRWDRRDNDDARTQQRSRLSSYNRKTWTTRQTGAKSNGFLFFFHFFANGLVSVAFQPGLRWIPADSSWQTERRQRQRQQRHLTPRSTSNKSTDGPTRGHRWQCAYSRKSSVTRSLVQLHAWISWGQKRKTSCPGLLKRTTKQAVAWREREKKKEEKKVTRVVLNKHNKPAEAHARSSAWWQSAFNSPNKCRKCEAVSRKKPRWTEKRLQYDLFREA